MGAINYMYLPRYLGRYGVRVSMYLLPTWTLEISSASGRKWGGGTNSTIIKPRLHGKVPVVPESFQDQPDDRRSGVPQANRNGADPVGQQCVPDICNGGKSPPA